MRRDIMGLEDTFDFGKFNRRDHVDNTKTLQDVIDKDPAYIEWLVKNNVVPFSRAAVQYMDSMDIEMTGA